MFKKTFDKIKVRDEEYNFVLDRICDNNCRQIIILCSIFLAIFVALISLAISGLGVSRNDMPVYIVSLVYASAVLLLVLKNKDNYKLIMIATYMVIYATMVYGLVVSYRSPGQYTASFIALMGVIFMTFVDKPEKLGLTNIFGAVICIAMIIVHKDASIRTSDIINVIFFSVLSLIGGYFTVKMKIHSYVMDKLQEQDIEKSLRKLKAKEFEASELLMAVKATYDMVVSVNLTKNTYNLVGDESFITQGDQVDGVFDEVIEIHAEKVVEKHRKLYYDTFSRQGLLKAFAEGKKEVYLEYQQIDENGVPHWLGTHTMFTANSESEDVTEITISQNIDERVNRELESKAILQEERDNAERARKAKTDFLFQMSHDIRTPMNAIIGYANFIKSSDDLYTIHNDYIIKLETAGQQLLMLINDALEMSRIESGKLVFCRENRNIETIILNVMSVMRIQADEKGVELISDFKVDNPSVFCDQNHMSRVIMNLLSNAVKFTPSGGNVKVSLHEKDTAPEGFISYELKIADTGIGMSPEFLIKVFEPFEREQTSTVSGMQGTGLGLAIVKRIVDSAEDTITVESEKGKGTVFTLNLTLFRGKQSETSDIRSVDTKNIPFEEMAEYFKDKRILLVEDNEFNLIIAKTLLENAGFTVETATDGRMAVNKVMGTPTENYYDAVLMDVQMPVMDGYEATREIRKLPDSRADIPVIAITANAFDTDKDEALKAGMNAHIAKPIDVSVLYDTLHRII